MVTSEAPDKDGEICDYATTAPLYRAWSAEFETATEGRSLGNVREMHTQSAVGKITALDCNDDAKTISVCAQVVDDDAWKKCEAGVYTGFSHGGRYLKVWPDEAGDYRRYTAEPNEISLVDNPCNPEAHFEYVKADGTSEVRKFAEEQSSVVGRQPAGGPARVDDAAAAGGIAAAGTPAATAGETPAVQEPAVQIWQARTRSCGNNLPRRRRRWRRSTRSSRSGGGANTRRASRPLANAGPTALPSAAGDKRVLKACLLTPVVS